MPLTAEEQFLLELINRARLDPLAEARRYGIDLNQGLDPGTLNGASRQVVAGNEMLNEAARLHSLWMLSSDIFNHTGAGGSAPWDRATAQGYVWSTIGENISWSGTTANSFDLETAVLQHHRGLFLSSGHRENLLNDGFREIGLGRETGRFLSNGTNWNASMLTELFGTSGAAVFLTGVAYTDLDADRFYSMGEGVGGIGFSGLGGSVTTAAAGGYSLALTASAAVLVTGTTALGQFVVQIDMSQGNVKLDLLGGTEFLTSGSLQLVSGINRATALGLDDLVLSGNNLSNVLVGNSGNNLLRGFAAPDVLHGGAGNDSLNGGDGNDGLAGGPGSDVLVGGTGNDQIFGAGGYDFLRGDEGDDLLSGGTHADRFVFFANTGADRITDFSIAQADRLVLDNMLWGNVVLTSAQVIAQYATIGAGGVLFDFGAQGSILLQGITTTAGLAAAIELV